MKNDTEWWTPEDQAILKEIPYEFLIRYEDGDIADFWAMVDFIQWGRVFDPDE